MHLCVRKYTLIFYILNNQILAFEISLANTPDKASCFSLTSIGTNANCFISLFLIEFSRPSPIYNIIYMKMYGLKVPKSNDLYWETQTWLALNSSCIKWAITQVWLFKFELRIVLMSYISSIRSSLEDIN